MMLAGTSLVALRRTSLWAAPLLLALSVWGVPITSAWIKAIQILLLAGSIIVWLTALWSRKILFMIVTLAVALVVTLFALPGRQPSSSEALGGRLSSALQSYEGTRYWWGGENKIGIDCSGLIRRGMMDAALREGLARLDGPLLRTSADLWWHDCSAEALGEGYRGYTIPITTAKSLNTLNHSLLQNGDLAIAGGGSHILAYLGDRRWIQADPVAEKVIIETSPSKNIWFSGPVKIVRWQRLAE